MVIVVALATSFVLVGFCAPIEQENEISKEFNCSKEELWNKVSNLEFYKQFKNEITEIEKLDTEGTFWRMFSKTGDFMQYEILDITPGEKIVFKITESNSGVESMRTYQLYGNNNSSVLTVKEHTRVEPILLRSTLAISGGGHLIKKEINNLHGIISLN